MIKDTEYEILGLAQVISLRKYNRDIETLKETERLKIYDEAIADFWSGE